MNNGYLLKKGTFSSSSSLISIKHCLVEGFIACSYYCNLFSLILLHFRSIAIPAISTGVFNYPREQATQVIIDTIKDYFNKNKDSVINEVYLCDIKSLVVEAFSAALEKSFRNVDVRESQKQAWKRLKDLPGK